MSQKLCWSKEQSVALLEAVGVLPGVWMGSGFTPRFWIPARESGPSGLELL